MIFDIIKLFNTPKLDNIKQRVPNKFGTLLSIRQMPVVLNRV